MLQLIQEQLHLLQRHLCETFACDTPFLHGGLGRKAALLQLEGWRIDGAEAGTPDATLRRLRARRAADELFD